MKTRGAAVAWMLVAAQAWGQTAEPQGSPTPAIRDIRPPLDVFPYPLWMVIAGAAIVLFILGLIAGLLIRSMRQKRPPTRPPTPKEVALGRLRDAEKKISEMQPYEFSIMVSDILRRYVTVQFKVRATEQTSPEFLAAAAQSPHFTGADKQLLAAFLERCDLIKFSKMTAGVDDSRALLEQAVKFVKGDAA